MGWILLAATLILMPLLFLLSANSEIRNSHQRKYPLLPTAIARFRDTLCKSQKISMPR